MSAFVFSFTILPTGSLRVKDGLCYTALACNLTASFYGNMRKLLFFPKVSDEAKSFTRFCLEQQDP